MATPKTYTPEEIARNREALLERGQRLREQQALRENEQINRYRQFQSDQGIDPDTIGTARIQRTGMANTWANNLMSSTDPAMRDYYFSQLRNTQTTAPEMAIPSIQQEYDAINAGNQIAGISSRERTAAYRLGMRAPWESASILNSIGMVRSARTGPSRSAEASRNYWLNRLGGAYNYRSRLLQSNGYAGY